MRPRGSRGQALYHRRCESTGVAPGSVRRGARSSRLGGRQKDRHRIDSIPANIWRRKEVRHPLHPNEGWVELGHPVTSLSGGPSDQRGSSDLHPVSCHKVAPARLLVSNRLRLQEPGPGLVQSSGSTRGAGAQEGPRVAFAPERVHLRADVLCRSTAGIDGRSKYPGSMSGLITGMRPSTFSRPLAQRLPPW